MKSFEGQDREFDLGSLGHREPQSILKSEEPNLFYFILFYFILFFIYFIIIIFF